MDGAKAAFLWLLVLGSFASFLAGRDQGKSYEELAATRMLVAARLPVSCWKRLEAGYNELNAIGEALHDRRDPR